MNLKGGNVGIGTTNPGEKLDVDGAIKLGTTTNTNTGTIRWSGSDFEGYNGSNWQSLTSGGSSLWTQTGSDIYYNTGNVGIGTMGPNYKLYVAGDINFTGTLYQNGSPFGVGSSLLTESGGNIYRSSGNVGIGTMSPSYDLDMGVGSIRSEMPRGS